MKNIIKSLLIITAFGFVATSCGEEPFDISDGGKEVGANLYVTSQVKYFIGVSSNITIELEKFEKEGVSITNIDYTVQYISKVRKDTSSVASFSVPGSSTAITAEMSEILASITVDGNPVMESDLQPSDIFTFDFFITLSDGSALDTPDGSVTTVLCNPMAGDYRIVMHDIYGDGWQTNDGNGGDGLQVTLGDGTVLSVGMCNPYVDSPFDCAPGDYSDAEDVITIPAGTQSADWFFPGDFYGEIFFEIYAPTGELLYASGAAGDLGTGGIALAVLICG